MSAGVLIDWALAACARHRPASHSKQTLCLINMTVENLIWMEFMGPHKIAGRGLEAHVLIKARFAEWLHRGNSGRDGAIGHEFLRLPF